MTTKILCAIWLENEVRKRITHIHTYTGKHTTKHQTSHKATELNIQTKTVGGLTIS